MYTLPCGSKGVPIDSLIKIQVLSGPMTCRIIPGIIIPMPTWLLKVAVVMKYTSKMRGLKIVYFGYLGISLRLECKLFVKLMQ